jgi:hypothetical protein
MFVVGVPQKQLILDQIAEVPHAAFGFRRLKSGYRGPLIRVRRASDNVERDIYYDVAGNLDTSDLLSFIDASSGFVTTLYDLSGQGINATQTTSASQWRIVNAGVLEILNAVNNRPAPATLARAPYTFNGGAVIQTVSVVSTWRVETVTASSGSVFGSVSVGGPQLQVGSNGTSLSFNRSGQAVLATASINATVKTTGAVTSVITTATGSTIFNNNAQVGSGASAPNFASAIGNIASTFAGSEPLSGWMAEQIVFRNTISASTRIILERNQAQYYGITLAA